MADNPFALPPRFPPASGGYISTSPKRGTSISTTSTSGSITVAPPTIKTRMERKKALEKKSQDVEFFIVDGDYDFRVTNHNLVQCESCGKSSWCEHIQAMLKKNFDAPQLWGQLITVPEGQLEELEVPMVPSFNLWAKVLLGKADMPTPCYKVELFLPLKSNTPGMDRHKEFVGENQFIGFIHPSEGRFILRSMLFTWFLGNVKINDLKCEYSHHKYAAEMSWQDDIKNPKKKMAQYWSVWSTSKCMFCGMGEPPDDSDLVPDISTPRYPR